MAKTADDDDHLPSLLERPEGDEAGMCRQEGDEDVSAQPSRRRHTWTSFPPINVDEDTDALPVRGESAPKIDTWIRQVSRSSVTSAKSARASISRLLDPLPQQKRKQNHRRASYFISEQKKQVIRSQNRYVLQSEWLCYWDILVFAGLIMTGITEPIILVFDIDEPWCRWAAGVISTVYMVDTIMNFFRAQKVSTREGVALVTDIRVLAKNYFFGMFLIDFVSALPLSLLVDKHWRRVKMLRMLRFIHTWRLMQNLQKLTSLSYSVLNMCEFAVILLFVLHWIACAWTKMERLTEESWLSQLKMRLQEQGATSEFEGKANEYLLSLYWSVTVISSVGFGDVTPVTKTEFMCAQICMAIGGGVWAYIVGSICSIVFTFDKHRHSFETLMNDVNVICRERHLPKDLQARVRDFYRHARDFMRMKEYHSSVRELSPALKGEVMKCMYGSHFKRVWYFDVVDDYTALLLVEGLIPKMYAREEWIEASVDHVRALVFLRSGVCVRKSNVLAPGAVWGLDVILSSEEHDDIEELLDTANARSITFTVVLKLSKHGIDHAARLVPAFAKRLRKAHLRMLLWRGAIAANRAMKQINKKTFEKPSGWDKLGKLVAKVVHRDRQLLDTGTRPLLLRQTGDTLPQRPSHMSMTSATRQQDESILRDRQVSNKSHASSVDSRPATPRAMDTGNLGPRRPSNTSLQDLPRRLSTSISLQDISSFQHGQESSAEHEPSGPAPEPDSSASPPVPPEGNARTRVGRRCETMMQAQPVSAPSSSSASRGNSRSPGKSSPVLKPALAPVHTDKGCFLGPGCALCRKAKQEQLPSLENPLPSTQRKRPRDRLSRAWKSELEFRIRSSDAKLSDMHAELSEEITAINEEVIELTRLMHQALKGLEAEENY